MVHHHAHTLSTRLHCPLTWRVLAAQVVSLWSNGLGAFLTLSSVKLHLDPAMTSAPLMTTIVDTTGLVIYFLIAQAIISQEGLMAALSNAGNALV